MISTDIFEEKANKINFDIQGDLFNEILKFLYTSSADVPKNPYDIFRFAHRYEISSLQDFRSNYIIDNIIIEALRLVHAESYRSHDSRKVVETFAKDNEQFLVGDSKFIDYYVSIARPDNIRYIYRLAMQCNLASCYKGNQCSY